MSDEAKGPEIPYDEVRIAWFSNSYDGVPLSGHAWYAGLYCLFKGGGYRRVAEPGGTGRSRWEAVWDLYELSGDALVHELAGRKLFEDMVGYHSTHLPDLGAGLERPRYGFTGGIAGDYKAYWHDPRWTAVSKRETDPATLRRIGTFADRGAWGTEPPDDDDDD